MDKLTIIGGLMIISSLFIPGVVIPIRGLGGLSGTEDEHKRKILGLIKLARAHADSARRAKSPIETISWLKKARRNLKAAQTESLWVSPDSKEREQLFEAIRWFGAEPGTF